LTLIHQTIREQGLTPNQFFLLLNIRENDMEYIISDMKDHNALLDMKLATMTPQGGHMQFDMTKEGETVLKKVEALFKPQKKGTPAQILGEGYQEKIQQYLEIFPKMKLPSGKAARSDKKNVEIAFAWFMSTYDYSWETIFKATANYVAEYELKNYLYMQTSQYFIRKQLADKSWGSELANRCSDAASGPMIEKEDHFKTKAV